MPKYQKRPDVGTVYVPGVGRLGDARVIEGEYDRFVPALLVRLPDEPAAAPKAAPKAPPPVPAAPMPVKAEPTVVMDPAKQAELVAATAPEDPGAQQKAATTKKKK